MSTAHLCIDMQVAGNNITWRHGKKTWDCLKRNVSQLITSMDRQHIPTIYVALILGGVDTFFGTLAALKKDVRFSPGFFMSSQMIDFPLKNNSLVAIKNACSAYTVPGLVMYLESNNIDTVILSGWSEGTVPDLDSSCLGDTARDLKKKNYKVWIAAEATNASFPVPFSTISYKKALPARQRGFEKLGISVISRKEIVRRLVTKKPASPQKTTPAQSLARG